MIGRVRPARRGRLEAMSDRLGRRTWVLGAWLLGGSVVFLVPSLAPAAPPGGNVTREEVEQAIKSGVNFLLKTQRPDGTWGNEPGESALVTLALLTAGESPDLRADGAGARSPPEVPAQSRPRDLFSCPHDDGPRRRRPQAISRRDRIQRRVAGAGPIAIGRLDLLHRPGPWRRRQLEHSVRACSASTPPARPASPSGPRSGFAPVATGS